MAIARKCDRCGVLYERYDDIECDGVPTNRVVISNGIINKSGYDLCPSCCLEFVRWLMDSETTVVKFSPEIKEAINKKEPEPEHIDPGPMGSNMYPKVDSGNLIKEEDK